MMATAEGVKAKLKLLIDGLNQINGELNLISGENDTTLVAALSRFVIWGLFHEPAMDQLSVYENGTYYPRDGIIGFNCVEVNVDTQQYYDQGYTDGQNSVDTSEAYQSGYATGYAEGYEAGRSSAETV